MMDEFSLPPEVEEYINTLTPDIDSGELLAAIVTSADQQPPPPWEWMLETMRNIMEAEGDSIGMVMAATANEAMMVPAPNGPHDPLKMLYLLRKTGAMDSINWVACVADTYVRVGSGYLTDGITPTLAFKAGLPDAWEGLMTICVAPDGPGYDMQQRYLRTPEGFVWEEPESMDTSIVDSVTGIMQEVVLA